MALNPTSTGSEMKLAMKPNRSTAATTSMTPTRTASAVPAATSPAVSAPGMTSRSADPTRIAIVVVVSLYSAASLLRPDPLGLVAAWRGKQKEFLPA